MFNEKEQILESLARPVMSAYEGAEVKVKVDLELPEITVEMRQVSVLSPFLLTIVVNVMGYARKCVLSEFLFANDLFMINDTIKGLRNKLIRWMESFESKSMKANLGRPQ